MDTSTASSLIAHYYNESGAITTPSNATAAHVLPSDTRAPLSALIFENMFSMILPYTTIFGLAILGNTMVMLTLGLNKRMRTVTNAFLFNLSVSDLLLGVFCMPFTLVGTLVREFIFGAFMCRCIPYLQAVSVSVSAWTLVAMSYERYYAICHPLKSRESRQTWSHTKKMIGSVWLVSLLVMSPIAILSELQPINGGPKMKCREAWSSRQDLIYFTGFLDIFLFIIPLLVMTTTYIRIAATLWKNMNDMSLMGGSESKSKRKTITPNEDEQELYNSTPATSTPATPHLICNNQTRDANPIGSNDAIKSKSSPTRDSEVTLANGSGSNVLVSKVSSKRFYGLRLTSATKDGLRVATVSFRCNQDQSRRHQQRRVIKMLAVVVIEFFVCWTPLHVINTIALIYPRMIYIDLGYKWISFFQLLAFFSSCTNPITYCFMNRNFRKSFLDLFKCSKAPGSAMSSTPTTGRTVV